MTTAYQRHVKAAMAKAKPHSLAEARKAMKAAAASWRKRNPAPVAKANPCRSKKRNPAPIAAATVRANPKPRPNPARLAKANPRPRGNPCPSCGGIIANPLPIGAFTCPYCNVGLENV